MNNNIFDASVGQKVPQFVRETGLENWNRFAAVNYEFVGIHMDDEAGRAAGYDSAFGMGNLVWSYLHSMLRGWIGQDGEIVSLRCQFRSPNTKGMTVTASGTIAEVRDIDGAREVTVDVQVSDQNGTVLTPGRAVVRLADRANTT